MEENEQIQQISLSEDAQTLMAKSREFKRKVEMIDEALRVVCEATLQRAGVDTSKPVAVLVSEDGKFLIVKKEG